MNNFYDESEPKKYTLDDLNHAAGEDDQIKTTGLGAWNAVAKAAVDNTGNNNLDMQEKLQKMKEIRKT